jgi:beta-phosphoglucomutase-like phosphatase (HAD superfamily)
MTAKRSSDPGLKGLWRQTSTVLFDVEGTLVDAVPFTLQCWQETLRDFGVEVSLSIVQCLSGMDSKNMLLRLLKT